MKHTYRFANRNDLRKLSQFVFDEFILETHETWGGRITPDFAKSVEWVGRILSQPNSLTIVAELGDEIAASLACSEVAFPWSLSDTRVVDEYFIVGREHRASSVAAELLRIAKDVADAHGKTLSLGVICGTHVDLKTRFFQRNGFQHMGGHFVRFPKPRAKAEEAA